MYEHEITGEIRDNLKAVCTDATAIEVAKHIVDRMDREADDETLEYDFHANLEKGEMTVDEAFAERNTWFKFDVRSQSILGEVKKAMFSADCNPDELEFINDFYKKVCAAILTNHAGDVERILRRVMFRDKPVPMKLKAVTNIEIIDFSQLKDEDNYQLVIEKNVPKDEVQSYAGVGISQELFKIHAETGEGFNAIIRRKKAEGDPNYKYVVGATTQKMLWEVQVDFFVDYFAK